MGGGTDSKHESLLQPCPRPSYLLTGLSWGSTLLHLHEVQGPLAEGEDPRRGLQREDLQRRGLNQVQVSGSGELGLFVVSCGQRRDEGGQGSTHGHRRGGSNPVPWRTATSNC